MNISKLVLECIEDYQDTEPIFIEDVKKYVAERFGNQDDYIKNVSIILNGLFYKTKQEGRIKMKERLKNFFIVVLSMMLSLTSLFLPIQSTKVNAAAVEPSTGNIYYIKNKNSGLYLQVANNSSNSGSNVIQANGTGAEGQR